VLLSLNLFILLHRVVLLNTNSTLNRKKRRIADNYTREIRWSCLDCTVTTTKVSSRSQESVPWRGTTTFSYHYTRRHDVNWSWTRQTSSAYNTCSKQNPSLFYFYDNFGLWDHTVLPVTRHKWAHPALTPARQVSTRFTYAVGMEGWVDLGDWLHTKMVYPHTDRHPYKY